MPPRSPEARRVATAQDATSLASPEARRPSPWTPWLGVGLALVGLATSASAAGPDPAAQVSNAVQESQLATVRLTPKADERLAIETATVERRSIPRTRTLGGELIVPSGRAITVAASQAGTVLPPSGGDFPTAGSPVERSEPVLRLLALPTGGLSRAQEAASLAEVRAEMARTKAARSKELVQDGAVSVRQDEEAQAELKGAEAELAAARAHVRQLSGKAPTAGTGALTFQVVTSPQDGVVQRVHVGDGQAVAAGTVLLEIISLDPLWVRVPVYAGDLPAIDVARGAVVRGLSSDRSSPARRAAAVATPPPSADPMAASVDLFFELANPDAALRPGQRVSVDVSLAGEEQSLVVPHAAILYDAGGGTWVYERLEPALYARRRVEVRHVVDGVAVLGRGPAPGTVVVTAGSAELFGTEFGGQK